MPSCARLRPRAMEWFVHSGEAQRMSVVGKYRGSIWVRSAQTWSASWWLVLWVSTASCQWLDATRMLTPGTWIAPVDDPPAPQKRSVIVRVMSLPVSHRLERWLVFFRFVDAVERALSATAGLIPGVIALLGLLLAVATLAAEATRVPVGLASAEALLAVALPA